MYTFLKIKSPFGVSNLPPLRGHPLQERQDSGLRSMMETNIGSPLRKVSLE